MNNPGIYWLHVRRSIVRQPLLAAFWVKQPGSRSCKTNEFPRLLQNHTHYRNVLTTTAKWLVIPNKECFIIDTNQMLCCFHVSLPVRSVLNSAELICVVLRHPAELEALHICYKEYWSCNGVDMYGWKYTYGLEWNLSVKPLLWGIRHGPNTDLVTFTGKPYMYLSCVWK